MEDKYASVLDRLGIPELVKLDADKDVALGDSLIKTVFYSNVNNGHESATEDLLYKGKFEGKDGPLSDYGEIMNLDAVLKLMKGINGHVIRPDDIVEVRRALLTGVYSQGKYLDGFRRYQLSVGPYISVHADEVPEAFKDAVDMLNVSYESTSMSLLNVAEFNANFTKLHPFEDGDGRTGRLFANYYLIRNGIKPLHVSESIRAYWPQSIHPYYFGKCIMPEVIATILRIVDNDDKIRDLADRAIALDKSDPYALSVRDHILIQTGSVEKGRISRAEIKDDAEKLYTLGSGSEELMISALELCLFTRTDSHILDEARMSKTAGVRANAIYAMAAVDFDKYRDRIIQSAFDDPSNIVRMSAVGQLGYGRHALDLELASRLLDNELDRMGSQSVMVSVAKYVSLKDRTSQEVSEFAKKLIDSGIDDLKIRGYLLIMKYCDDEAVIDAVKAAAMPAEKGRYTEPDHIRKGIVVELKRADRLNNDRIAELFSDLAVDDRVVREALLGDLIVTKSIDGVNTRYDRLFDEVLKGNYPMFDRAYSIYLLGMREGYDAMVSRHGLDEAGFSKLEKLAANLVKFGDMSKGRLDCAELFRMMDEKDQQLLAVNLVELGRLIRERSVTELTDGLAADLHRHIKSRSNPLFGLVRHRRHETVLDINKLFENVNEGLVSLSKEPGVNVIARQRHRLRM
jgi:hypothetical protein